MPKCIPDFFEVFNKFRLDTFNLKSDFYQLTVVTSRGTLALRGPGLLNDSGKCMANFGVRLSVPLISRILIKACPAGV